MKTKIRNKIKYNKILTHLAQQYGHFLRNKLANLPKTTANFLERNCKLIRKNGGKIANLRKKSWQIHVLNNGNFI